MALSKAKKIRAHIISEMKRIFPKYGWEEDRYGNLKKTNEKGQLYRIKFNDNALRYEVQIVYEATDYMSQSKSWSRIKSGYYKDIEIIETNNGPKLKGLS